MNILFLGSGYVGLVSGACFAELGFNVVTADIDSGKIKSLKKGVIPIYEPGLEELVKKNSDSGRLSFSSNIEKEVKNADVIFIAVGTPSQKNGKANLNYVFDCAKTIAKNAKDNVVIVTKSTVPVGTGEKIKKLINKTNKNLQFNLASNPEFLREGTAVNDFMNPDRVVIGIENDYTEKTLAKLYKKLISKNAPLIVTNIKSAELAKYAANSYLAMRIAFVNELADLCDAADANIDDVTKVMGTDFRIGKHYLKAGPGFGGSCFPKDTKAFINIAEEFGAESKIISSVIDSNENHKKLMVQKIINSLDGKVNSKTIAILGTAFKANTDDIRDSASLVIINELLKKGAKVKAYDPEAAKNTKAYFKEHKNFSSLSFANSMESCIKSVDAIVITTEWDEFKTLSKFLRDKSVIIDLRNILTDNNSKKQKILFLGK